MDRRQQKNTERDIPRVYRIVIMIHRKSPETPDYPARVPPATINLPPRMLPVPIHLPPPSTPQGPAGISIATP